MKLSEARHIIRILKIRIRECIDSLQEKNREIAKLKEQVKLINEVIEKVEQKNQWYKDTTHEEG